MTGTELTVFLIALYCLGALFAFAHWHDNINSRLRVRTYFGIGIIWPIIALFALFRFIPVVGSLLGAVLRLLLLGPFYLATGLVGAVKEVAHESRN